MSYEVSCEALGIEDCDFVARGETPADVIEQVAGHLRHEHDVDLPDTDVVLDGEFIEREIGQREALVVRRLRAALDLEGAGDVDERLESRSTITAVDLHNQ